MQKRSQNDLYQDFIEFISRDIQRERYLVNRRMLSVFVWCFFLPALVSATVLLLVKLGVLPRSVRSYLDWLVLILPIFYSLYILGFEVLAQVPSAFRKGKIATSLAQAIKENEWRQRVMGAMLQSLNITPEEWNWLIVSFRMDLLAMQNRTRYLTALAGAVFFLLMQGIDSLTDNDEKLTWTQAAFLGWVESSSNYLAQFVGLALFLVLLYLSGSQTYQSLKRYLNCAELIQCELEGRKRTGARTEPSH
jgi:hypothetical protein